MSDQGERQGPRAEEQDDWWRELYDDDAPDTGRGAAEDTIDDRFDSVTRTVGQGEDLAGPEGEQREAGRAGDTGPESESEPEPESAPPPVPSGEYDGEYGTRERTVVVEQPLPAAKPDESGAPLPPEVPFPAEEFAAAVPARATPRREPPPPRAQPGELPAADLAALSSLVPDTVLDGARHGAVTLCAASVRGDTARLTGEPRRDALLTARFGTGDGALLLVAVATGAGTAEEAHRAAREACHSIGEAIGRSHQRLAEDILAGRRGALKAGLKRLTDRSHGQLRAQAAALGMGPAEHGADLRCLLLPAAPHCTTRLFFGMGSGGLFRLRDGVWQDIEPRVTELPPPGTGPGEAEQAAGEPEPRPTMNLGIATPSAPGLPQPEPFRFRASAARPGDLLLLCGTGLAEPLRGAEQFADSLAECWSAVAEPPDLAAFLTDMQAPVNGYGGDRTAAAVWEDAEGPPARG